MNNFGTKELLDQFFATRPEYITKKTRTQLDRDELYAYEEKINKPLVEMNAEEILEMIRQFVNKNYTTKKTTMSFRTYDMLISMLRNFFEWYIDNVKLIRNPCNDKMLKGNNVTRLLYHPDDVVTPDIIESGISRIQKEKAPETAEYLEAIVRMFYEGFPTTLDIVRCKTGDINHKLKTARLARNTVSLSDRLYELLVSIHSREEIPAHHGTYAFISYHDSFFKFPTFWNRVESFQDLPEEYPAGHISRVFNKDISGFFDINVNARKLYIRGFYDWMLKRMDAARIAELVTVPKHSGNAAILMGLAKEYGLAESNVSAVKKILIPFTMQEN